MTLAAQTLDDAFRRERGTLFGLAYRLTGSVADADEIVQDAFARALTRPPEDETRPLGPWLTRVATNLAIDRLRQRRRQRYVGPWLPAPLDTTEAIDDLEAAPEARYGARESATYAFLIALEALTPMQRAVLVLRDVLDYTGEEAAKALDTSAGSVKVTLHRARRAMASYDAHRCIPDPARVAAVQAVLERFLSALVAQDVAALETILRADVVGVNDANGEFHAARVPVVGRERVAHFHLKLARTMQVGTARLAMINHLPALIAEYAEVHGKAPPRFVFRLELDPDGRIGLTQTVVASAKLVGIRFG